MSEPLVLHLWEAIGLGQMIPTRRATLSTSVGELEKSLEWCDGERPIEKLTYIGRITLSPEAQAAYVDRHWSLVEPSEGSAEKPQPPPNRETREGTVPDHDP